MSAALDHQAPLPLEQQLVRARRLISQQTRLIARLEAELREATRELPTESQTGGDFSAVDR